MVSFFGLKIGGEKKKKADNYGGSGGAGDEAPQWKRVDQNSFGEGRFFGANSHKTGVVNGSIREVPSRPGTSQSMRPSPYTLQTHNLAASSMYDLSNMPAIHDGTGLKSSASATNLGMRLGNTSTASFVAPPPRPGMPQRPGTSGGERKKPWVNPLDIHFGRAATTGPSPLTNKSPLSPLVKFELSVDVDGSGSLMHDMDKSMTCHGVNHSNNSSINRPTVTVPPTITQVNSASPTTLSPLATTQPISPPTSFTSSPPMSVDEGKGGMQSLLSDGKGALRPNRQMPTGIGPTGLPSPALSRAGSGDDRISPWDPPPPVIRTVGARRDTLTMGGPRRQSLSMKIEELEKSLVDAQQESEQRIKNKNSPPRTQATPFEDRERLPSLAFPNEGRRSPMGRASPSPMDFDADNTRGREEQRPIAPFANRGPRPQSPLGRGPASRTESPMGRGPMAAAPQSPVRQVRTGSPMGYAPASTPQSPPMQEPPPRNPLRNVPPAMRAPSPANPTHIVSAGIPIERSESPVAPAASFPQLEMATSSGVGSATIATRAGGGGDDRPSPVNPFNNGRPHMANGPGPTMRGPPRGPGAPRRPAPEEYGIKLPLPRSNSDKERGTGPPPGAAGAQRGMAAAARPPQPIVEAKNDGMFQNPRQSPEQPKGQPVYKPFRPQQQQGQIPPQQETQPYHYRQPPQPQPRAAPEPKQPQRPRALSDEEFTFEPTTESPPPHQQTELFFPAVQTRGFASNSRQNTLRPPPPAPITLTYGAPGSSNTLGVFDGSSTASSSRDEDASFLSGPPTPDSANWPLPSPGASMGPSPLSGLAGLAPPPPMRPGPNRSITSPSPTTNRPSPLNLGAARERGLEIGAAGPFTPPPQRSMTTPFAACDEPRPKTAGGGGGGSGAIGMARGLSLRYEREGAAAAEKMPPPPSLRAEMPPPPPSPRGAGPSQKSPPPSPHYLSQQQHHRPLRRPERLGGTRMQGDGDHHGTEFI